MCPLGAVWIPIWSCATSLRTLLCAMWMWLESRRQRPVWVISGGYPELMSLRSIWHHTYTYIVECHYNAVQYNKILYTVLEIPTGPSVRGRQLWRRTGNFLVIFLQFYVYDLKFKAWGPTTFLTEFQTLIVYIDHCSDGGRIWTTNWIYKDTPYLFQRFRNCCVLSHIPIKTQKGLINY